MSGGYIFAPSSVDLTAPPTNIGTTTPPAITASTIFRSGNSGNIPFVAQPLGTGAFQLQQTDNTATGGNARGINAIDLQTARSSATEVASGSYSVVIGRANTGSGGFSSAIGFANICSGSVSFAAGNSNQSTSSNSVAIGVSNVSSGAASVAMGNSASTKSIDCLFAMGNGVLSGGAGKSQTNMLALAAVTTGNTPQLVLSSTSIPAATNQLTLQNNSALIVKGFVIATVTGAGNTSSWEITATIKRGANAASTALVGTPTVSLVHQDAGASGWSVAVTVDTTNGCLAVTVTGQTATTIRWNCSLFVSEVAF